MFSGLWGTFFHLMSGPSTFIVCGVFDHRHKGKILSLPCSLNSKGRWGGHVKNSHTRWVSQSKGACIFEPFVGHNGEQTSLEWLRGFYLGNLLLGSWQSYKTIKRGGKLKETVQRRYILHNRKCSWIFPGQICPKKNI